MDHKYIVVGIDGTDSDDWMENDGSNSHVFKFIKHFYGIEGINVRYLPGPTQRTFGRDTEQIIKQGLDFIYQRLATLFPGVITDKIKPLNMYDINLCMQRDARNLQNRYVFLDHPVPPVQRVTKGMLMNQKLSTDDVRIILVGHSRGGLAVTQIARMLSPVVRVYFMGLYDSVDMQPCLDGMNVENVKFVVHAKRNPEVRSRMTFRNTSLNYIGVDDKEEAFFDTSHGGIGGDFVTTYSGAGWDGDFSCIPHTFRKIGGLAFYPVPRNPKMMEKHGGKLMNAICADGSRKADQFMRAQAIRFGVPIY
jgi:hypothetical protein